MPSALVAARKAALAHFRESLAAAETGGVDVLDRAPLRYRLPYWALISGQQTRERKNKRAVSYEVRLVFQLTSNPHDGEATTDDELIDGFDLAAETKLDLSGSGFGIRDQYLEEIEPFTDTDERGAELHRTDVTLLLEIT